jgi:hypothetical protein
MTVSDDRVKSTKHLSDRVAAVILAPFALAVFALVIFALVLFCPYVVLRGTIADWWRRARLRRAQRLMTWEAATGRLAQGLGMLLVELTPHGFADAWWISESLPDCPLPGLDAETDSLLPVWKRLQDADVYSWCANDLPSHLQKAWLVNVPKYAKRSRFTELPPSLVRIAPWEVIQSIDLV